MTRRQLVSALSPLITLAAPITAFATPPELIWCSGCTSTDKANAALGRPAGIVYVGDTTANTVVAYRVYVDAIDTIPPQHVKTADVMTPVSPAKDLAFALIDYYHTAPVGWAKNASVNYHTGNVYDTINPGVAQNNMTDYFYNNSFVGTFAQRLVGVAAAVHLVDQSAVPKTVFRVNFDDGSHVDIVVDLTATAIQGTTWISSKTCSSSATRWTCRVAGRMGLPAPRLKVRTPFGTASGIECNV